MYHGSKQEILHLHYEPCTRKHHCCQCLHYHREQGELPACFFTPEFERTYDRSIGNFIKMRNAKAS